MLSRINPTARLAANLLALLVCVLVSDAMTPLLLLAAALMTAWWGGALRRHHLAAAVPFIIFAAGMLWMNAAWARVPGAVPVARLGPLIFTDGGLALGVALALRVLAVGALSILFTATLDPTDLMLSLVQQCRLSPRIAYSLMAALRFLPILETELRLIRSAHRIRGTGTEGPLAGPRRWYRYAMPLLAGGIRRAERVALAMEARGFSGNGPRTYYRTIRWQPRDTGFLLATFAVLAAILGISARMGWLRGPAAWAGF